MHAPNASTLPTVSTTPRALKTVRESPLESRRLGREVRIRFIPTSTMEREPFTGLFAPTLRLQCIGSQGLIAHMSAARHALCANTNRLVGFHIAVTHRRCRPVPDLRGGVKRPLESCEPVGDELA